MPDYEPGEWNGDTTLVKINNCYNYATNKKNSKPPAGEKLPEGAEPGKSKKVTAKQYKGLIQVGKQIIPLFDYECEGLKAAAKLDGLKDTDPGNTCASGCWLVAYYVRRLDTKKKLFGDFHFVRKDSNGKWSHKPGDGPVTNQKYNKKTGKYDGGEITDPATDPVGLGPYIHCGYLCVCPDEVSIAAAPPMNQDGLEDKTLVTLGGSLAMKQAFHSAVSASTIEAETRAVARRLDIEWTEGMGGGDLLYRIDLTDTKAVFVADISLTLWDDSSLLYLDDPGGVGSARFAELLGLCSPGTNVWRDVSEDEAKADDVHPVSNDSVAEHLLNSRLIARAALIASISIPLAIVILGLISR